jgi:hypothetical protein
LVVLIVLRLSFSDSGGHKHRVSFLGNIFRGNNLIEITLPTSYKDILCRSKEKKKKIVCSENTHKLHCLQDIREKEIPNETYDKWERTLVRHY